ncbi:MAG: tyrosine--tRNA ligase [Patescibacteria group bacterium]|nr:tyrosine--tRNA ligase [Patescibacteria group bacterium]
MIKKDPAKNSILKTGELKNILGRGVDEVIEKEHLLEALNSGRKLRVKMGIDPTRPDIHLGHTVALRKLRQFQELGHKAVLIIGDFTAQIGDPSGQSAERKPLSEKEIRSNLKGYLNQAGKVIDIKKAEIHYNSEWFKKNGLEAMLTMARAATFQQVIKREDFQKRLEANKDISVLEILYPLLQGYDSVKIKADVEIGGTDQKFNMLMGRRVQRYFNQPEQDIITVPIIEGTDGVRKMSKSYGNYIGLEEDPEMMFGKLMSVPDCLVDKYFALLTDSEPDKESNLYENKKLLAWTIVEIYNGEKAANQARENFIKTFSRKETPEEMPEIKLESKETTASDLIIFLKMAQSKNEAKRLIEQGGLKIEGKTVKGPADILNFSGGETIKVGKYHFFKIK